MQEFKGTPGKWTVANVNERDIPGTNETSGFHAKTADIQDENANNIAIVQGYDTVFGLFAPSTSVDANARLIAAAPELLESLQDFVNSCYSGCSKEELNLLRIKAEEVINKVTATTLPELTETI